MIETCFLFADRYLGHPLTAIIRAEAVAGVCSFSGRPTNKLFQSKIYKPFGCAGERRRPQCDGNKKRRLGSS
tara:strand:- start:3862 stop:4077 length:216 start_codon:yes stop_codon:yes gene_type:complete